MIPAEVLIPAVISLIIAVAAHITSLIVSRSTSKNKLDITNIGSLENQLEAKSQEVSGLRQSNLDLRDLRYQLELKIESLKRERDEHNEEIAELRNDIIKYREEIFALKQKLAELEEKG